MENQLDEKTKTNIAGALSCMVQQDAAMDDRGNATESNFMALTPEEHRRLGATKDERQIAIYRVLSTLLHPMKMHCIPDREKAYELANKHQMTAIDLLDAARIERSHFTIEG